MSGSEKMQKTLLDDDNSGEKVDETFESRTSVLEVDHPVRSTNWK